MPRPKKTTAQLDATREKILDAALSILQVRGYEAITSRAIAESL
jgi:AcrR family transcriptional regulator